MCQSNQNLNLPPPPSPGNPWVFYCCLCPGGAGNFCLCLGGQGILTLPRWDISTKSVRTFQCSAHLLMEEFKDQESCLVIKWLRKKFLHQSTMLTSKKPNSSTKNQYVTLLSSTTFIDNTKNHSILGGAFESNFCPGGGGVCMSQSANA